MKAGLQAKCKNRSVACEKCTNERPCWDCCQRCVCWDCDERQLIQSPVEDLAASLTSKIVERLGPLEYYRQQSLLGTTLGRRLEAPRAARRGAHRGAHRGTQRCRDEGAHVSVCRDQLVGAWAWVEPSNETAYDRLQATSVCTRRLPPDRRLQRNGN